MGLDSNGVRFALYARMKGVDYSHSATIGRQGLHLSLSELEAHLNEFSFSYTKEATRSVFQDHGGYSEGFFHCLGANVVDSFDNSSYEDATHLHDMNMQIPGKFKSRYSVVVDGGSLEHVFNFPTAIKNCMEMVNVGGHYIGLTPSNNLLGHGFYQFSPELFFSAFTSQNGFKLIDVVAVELQSMKWYSVSDPKIVRKRVTLVNRNPTYLMVLAQKLSETSIFKVAPQQTDYLAMWDGDDQFVHEPDIKRPLQVLAERWIPRRGVDQLKRIFRSSVFGFRPPSFNTMTPSRVTESENVPRTFAVEAPIKRSAAG